MSDWAVEPHDEIPELDPKYQPVRSHWSTLGDKLDNATMQQLQELARFGIGEPDTSPISQVNELADRDEL